MAIGARYSAKNIDILTNRGLFFDANILLFLFFTTTSTIKQQNYSDIFKKLLKQGNNLIIDPIIISEVINRAMREEHVLFSNKNKTKSSFKDYRNSNDGKRALERIHNIFDEIILPRFSLDGKIYSKTEIESFLCINDLDFNDKLICKLCEEKNYILFTDDKDFISSSIDILSANSLII